MKSGIPGLLSLLALALSGCSYLRLMQPMRISPDDWVQYGGSIERRNATPVALLPPLALAWEFDASAGFSSSSATIAESILFIGNLQGEIQAVQIHSGKRVGAYSFGAAIIGAPVIDNDRIFVAVTRSGGSLISYNTVSGNIEWRAQLGDIESSPLMIGPRLYVTTLGGTLACVEKNNGDIRWRYAVPTRDRTKLIHSSPASDGTIVTFGCDNGVLYAVGADDGKPRWSAPTRGSIVGSPSIDGGRVFIGSLDSSFYCFDLQTGTMRWQTPLGSKIVSSQAVGLRHVYVGTAGRNVYCLDEETGTVVWSQRTDGAVNASPFLAGSVVYVGCIDKVIYAYNAETGEKVWQYKAEGRIKTMPIVAKNHLFVFAEDRSVLGFAQEVKH